MSPDEVQTRLIAILREHGPRMDDQTAEDVFNGIWAEFEIAPRSEIAALRVLEHLLAMVATQAHRYILATRNGNNIADMSRRDLVSALAEAGFPRDEEAADGDDEFGYCDMCGEPLMFASMSVCASCVHELQS